MDQCLKNSRVPVFLLLLSLTLISCQKPSEQLSFSPGSIFNGEPALKSGGPLSKGKGMREGAPEVVALVSEGRIFCSGVAVHPRLVLTAAHCLEDDKKPFEKNIKVYTGQGKEEGYVEATHEIEKAEVSPLYRGLSFAIGLSDVAYIKLKNPLPGVKGVHILLSPEAIRQSVIRGKKALLIGFGRRGKEKKDGFGLKYQAELTVKAFTSNEVHMEGVITDACPGDSGGPVFTKDSKGQWKLLALVSRGTGPHCNGKEYDASKDAYTGLGSETYYSLVFDSLCWISKDSEIPLEGASEHCYGEKLKIDTESPSFLNLCFSKKSLRPSKRETVLALLEKVGESDCNKAWEKLQYKKHLDLSRFFLTDVSPLLSLSSLETLNLESNKWKNLDLLASLKSLKEITFTYQTLHFRDYLKVLEEGIKIQFDRDLYELFVVESHKIIEDQNWEKYHFYLKMGLNPESILVTVTSWENRPFFDDIITKIETFEDDYTGTSALDFAIYQNDLDLFISLLNKKAYIYDSLTTVIDENKREWVDYFIRYGKVTAQEFLWAALDYEEESFTKFLVKEKDVSLKKAMERATKEEKWRSVEFLKTHFPEEFSL